MKSDSGTGPKVIVISDKKVGLPFSKGILGILFLWVNCAPVHLGL